MTDKQFAKLCNSVLRKLKPTTPIDTGNLRYNAFKISFEQGGKACRFWIDEDIAPYMVYTNESWVSDFWHGRKNPNEGWWQKTISYAQRLIEQALQEQGNAIAYNKDTGIISAINDYIGSNK